MIFKYIYKVQGQHVHVKVYAGEFKTTLAQAGTLCYNVREWSIFMTALSKDNRFVFEEQIISGPATRGNNGFHPPLA
jgi:hypothetical protein